MSENYFIVSPPSKTVEIAEVKNFEGFTTKVVLQGGHLQGIVDGEYDVYDPRVTDERLDAEEKGPLWLGQINISENDIEAIKSYGTVLYTNRDGPKVNCTFVWFKKGPIGLKRSLLNFPGMISL